MNWPRLATLVMCALLFGPRDPVLGQQSSDVNVCTGGTNLDAKIAACSRLIKVWSGKRQFGAARAGAHNTRGFAHLQKGQFDQAIADFTDAIRETARLSPKNAAAAYNNRGFTNHLRGQFDQAVADYTEAIRLDSSNGVGYTNRGNSWTSKGDYDRAIADHDRAIRIDPKNANIYGNRGAAWREKGDLDRAIVDFDQAIKLDPKSPFPYASRGVVWRARGDFDRAVAEFNRAIQLNPKFVSAHAERGLAYEGKGDFERAQADFKAAVALPPASADYTRMDVRSTRAQEMARMRLKLLSRSGTTNPPIPQQPSTATFGRRIALVIGNGSYLAADALTNPPNDARAVATVLRAIGFEVSEGIDLDRAGMDRFIREFLLRAVKARIALLFYAGHGAQIDGRNYLVPVDANFANIDAATSDMMEVNQILAGLDDQIRANIVVLDACRNIPLAQQTVPQAEGASRSVTFRGLARVGQPGAGATAGAGTLIVFATAPGQIALDGDGANSPFSTALVRHISTPGLEVQQMLTRVRAEVVAATRNKQVPWSNSSLLGEVYLAGGSQ